MGLPVRHHTILNSTCKSYSFTIRIVIVIIIIIIIIITTTTTLCRVFTSTYLKQTMLLGYILLQLFCSYNLWYINHAECRVLSH
jgi:hypothetical protein